MGDMSDTIDFDSLRRLLPDLPELRPLLDAALRVSVPDPDEAWTSAGELATVGARRVDPAALARESDRVAAVHRRHVDAIYEVVAEVLSSKASGDGQSVVRTLLRGAALEEAAGRTEETMAFAMAAVDAARSHDDPVLTTLALRRLARASRAAGDLDSASRLYEEALAGSRGLDDAEGLAEAAIGAGNVQEQRGRWDEAEARYQQARTALETVSPPTPAHWHVLLNLHIVHRSRGDVERSIDWLDRASALAEALPDPAAVPLLENARGQLEMAQEAPERAERHFVDALQAANGLWARSTIRLNLAESHLARDRLLDAAEHARDAERDAIVGSLTAKLPEVYRMLGRIAAANRNPDGFVLFERSLELSGSASALTFERAQTLQAYAMAEQALDHPESASPLWIRAIEAYRSLGINGVRRPWADCFDLEPTT
ncbi:MAG: tetratricopeptide repeat protein [Gemmatimonadota bacterium]